jgi:hypothetical protein
MLQTSDDEHIGSGPHGGERFAEVAGGQEAFAAEVRRHPLEEC